MKTVQVKCTNCLKLFERAKKQYDCDNVRKGMLPFCGLSCKTIYRNKHIPSYVYKKTQFDIKQFSNNRLDEYSPFKQFLRISKSRSKKNNMECDLDLVYLKELWESQNGVCSYTELKMDLPKSTSDRSFTHSLKKASLDRIDSSKGYIKGNVEFVCMFINFAKNAYNKEDVKSFLSEVKNGGITGIRTQTVGILSSLTPAVGL